MILIKSKLRNIPINIDELKKDIEKILKNLGYSDFDIGFLLTTNTTIRKYNKQYRNKDKATDVLSFPFYADLKPGQPIKVATDAEKNLGDVIISIERILHDAAQLGISIEPYLRKIVVHGICHLLGYTHDTDRNYIQMEKKESELLKILKGAVAAQYSVV